MSKGTQKCAIIVCRIFYPYIGCLIWDILPGTHCSACPGTFFFVSYVRCVIVYAAGQKRYYFTHEHFGAAVLATNSSFKLHNMHSEIEIPDECRYDKKNICIMHEFRSADRRAVMNGELHEICCFKLI